MPDWTAFGAVAGFVLFLVLGLAWLTSDAFDGRRRDRSGPDGQSTTSRGFGDHDTAAGSDAANGVPAALPGDPRPRDGGDPEPLNARSGIESAEQPAELGSVSTATLLVNVAFTHGGMGLLLLGAAAMTGVPAAALGADGSAWSTGAPAVLGGLALGGALAAVNVTLAASLDRVGVDHSEDLRAALAPDSRLGWVVLLGAILPLVAAFEELLFRAVLIGAAAAATGVSPWPFVVASTVAFALGHGIQGRGGVVVTGLLGGVLAVAFVLTNSLLLVVLAHYVVNAVEFLLKEWLDVDLGGRL